MWEIIHKSEAGESGVQLTLGMQGGVGPGIRHFTPQPHAETVAHPFQHSKSFISETDVRRAVVKRHNITNVREPQHRPLIPGTTDYGQLHWTLEHQEV